MRLGNTWKVHFNISGKRWLRLGWGRWTKVRHFRFSEASDLPKPVKGKIEIPPFESV